MNQKRKNYIYLFVIIALAVVSAYGLFARGLGLGLDLKGGLNVVLTAKDTPKNPVNDKTMEQALFIMRSRVDKLGVSEPSIEQHGKNNIIVQLPGVKDSDEALDIIGKTALLEFAIVEEKYKNRPVFELNDAKAKGEKVLGPTLLTGDSVSNASPQFAPQGGSGYQVNLQFKGKGIDKFGEITTKYTKKQLAIVLDGSIITAPTIQQPLTTGDGVITGMDSFEEAKKVSLVLQTGQLPFELKISQQQQVGPTLGKDSLKAAFIAAIIGFILVALFMLGFYRVFGLISIIGLGLYILLLLGSMVLLDIILGAAGLAGISLSLPSMAGLILMIGVAADSSIIIFERIKEETRSGRSFRTAIDTGFSHGFQTFLDADLVTFLTAAILFYFGIGLVKGFALTLMLGITVDLIISLFYKRSVLKIIASKDLIKNPSWIGLKEVKNE